MDFGYYILIIVGVGLVMSYTFRNKWPIGLTLFAGAVAATIVAGYGLPLRNLWEGAYYFLDLQMIVVTGILFVTIFRMSGAFEALTRLVIYTFHKSPALLLFVLIVLVMLPAMLTGSAPVSVMSTGMLVAPVLLRIGVPRIQAAGILAMGGLLGQSAPPVNVMVMIIANSTFMPYSGFMLPLALLTFPLAAFSAIFIGRKWVDKAKLMEVVEETRMIRAAGRSPVALGIAAGVPAVGQKPVPPFSVVTYLPLIAVLGLMFGPLTWPLRFPDLAVPFIFVLGGIIGLLTARRVNIIAASREAMKNSLKLIGLFAGIGMIVQAMSLTGLKGFIGVLSLSAPDLMLYPVVGIVAALVGGPFVPFGASALIGPPFVLAFQHLNAIIVTSAISLFLSLGCLVPPSAVSGIFAAQVMEVEDQYGKVIKTVAVPVILQYLLALVTLIFATQIGKFLGV